MSVQRPAVLNLFSRPTLNTPEKTAGISDGERKARTVVH